MVREKISNGVFGPHPHVVSQLAQGVWQVVAHVVWQQLLPVTVSHKRFHSGNWRKSCHYISHVTITRSKRLLLLLLLIPLLLFLLAKLETVRGL